MTGRTTPCRKPKDYRRHHHHHLKVDDDGIQCRRRLRQRPRPSELLYLAICFLQSSSIASKNTDQHRRNESTNRGAKVVDRGITNGNIHENVTNNKSSSSSSSSIHNSQMKMKGKRKIPTFTNASTQQQQQQHSQSSQLKNHSPRGPVETNRSDHTMGLSSTPGSMMMTLLQEQEFMDWCRKVLGIESLLDIAYFPYPDFMKLQQQQQDEMDQTMDDDFCDDVVVGSTKAIQNHNNNNHNNPGDDFKTIPPPSSSSSSTTSITNNNSLNSEKDNQVIQSPESQQQQKQQRRQLDAVEEKEEDVMLQVRGLAASRDIEQGEVVLRIPFQALMTMTTIIDHDPVLSRVMGPQARILHGWTDDGEDVSFFELPLLTVAILHHAQLGRSSPLYHYVQILKSTPTDHMPVLWSKERLKKEANDSVRQMALEIKRDIAEMYSTIVPVLKREHPFLFTPKNNNLEEDAFSLSRFRWAFSLVNSRHWHLPLPDVEDGSDHSNRRRTASSSSSSRHHHVLDGEPAATPQVVPPASQPTDAWIRESQEAAEDTTEKVENEKQHRQPPYESTSSNHALKPTVTSFMAPLAELLNFGPPCTRGTYNTQSHAFEIVATCSYRKGQEVTFWYSDDCENVMISNYGFTHPMIPKCPTIEDWKRQAESMTSELRLVIDELQQADKELVMMQKRLEQCQCDDSPTMTHHTDSRSQTSTITTTSHQKPDTPTRLLRHDPNGVRGSGSSSSSSNSGSVHSQEDGGGRDRDDHHNVPSSVGGGGGSSSSSSSNRGSIRPVVHGGAAGTATTDYNRGHGVRRMWQERKKFDLGL